MLNGIIYLRTPVDECIRRIVKRNRGEETSIDKEYLTMIQEKYDGFLNECSIATLVINGNYDINRDSNKIAENINKFMHPSRTASVILE
jgi:deoxyadenosine/deoxycytidine kinase